MCYNVETLQFYLGDIAEPFEGIDLIIVSIFETKGLALLASSFGNICSRRLFIYTAYYVSCVVVPLLFSWSLAKEQKLLRGILEPYSLFVSLNMSIIYPPLLFS